MNKLLEESNYYEILEKTAKSKKMARDLQYKEYIDFILNYCKNKNIILYINEKEYTIYLYTNNIFYIGKNICDGLFKKFADPYFKLTIVHKKMLTSIHWKYFLLCKIYDVGIIINNKKTLKISEIINYNEKDNIKYFADNELLIKSLDILTDLEHYNDWEDELFFANDIIKKLYNRKLYDLPTIEIIGGSTTEKQMITSDFLKSKIVEEFLPRNDDFILTGVWVYNLLSKKEKKNRLYTLEEIDVISVINKSDDALKVIENFLKTYVEYTSIVNRIIRIPFDEFTEKFTIYVVLDKRKVPIINIYNTASFKLIPYITSFDEIKITSLLYLMKILCINVYWQNIYLKIGIIDDNKFKIKKNIYENIIIYLLGNKYMKENIFTNTYYGIFIEKTILLKDLHLNEMFHPYHPYLSK